MPHLQIDVGRLSLAVVRLSPEAEVPPWIAQSRFVSITQTEAELSVVCDETCVPDTAQAQRGYRYLMVRGPLDFSLTGILASLATPLAEAKVPIFALSTYDTDYILVSDVKLGLAVQVLRAEGHSVDLPKGSWR